MIFEDWHYVDIVSGLYKKYNFSLLLKPEKSKKIEEEYKKRNINLVKWGFYIDTSKFKIRKLNNDMQPFINLVSYNSEKLFKHLMESFRREINESSRRK